MIRLRAGAAETIGLCLVVGILVGLVAGYGWRDGAFRQQMSNAQRGLSECPCTTGGHR